MSYRIWMYLMILVLGIFISQKNWVPLKYTNKINKLQSVVLCGIMLVMGLGIGMDQKVIGSIQYIGYEAMVFTFFTVGFSILFVYVGRKLLGRNKD